jgi:hypothetical protein
MIIASPVWRTIRPWLLAVSRQNTAPADSGARRSRVCLSRTSSTAAKQPRPRTWPTIGWSAKA